MKSLLFVTILLFSTSLLAQQRAGVLTEPYAGYFQGSSSGSDIGDADIRSYTYGARLGYQTEGGWNYGIDYSQGDGKLEPDGATDKMDYNSKDGGVFIGYAFPAYIKVWASYIFKHEATVKDAGGSTEIDGKGFNVGIGIRGIPHISVNLSYQERELDKIDGQAFSGSDNKTKLTMLSLSLPYNFPWKP